jgi:hypothetical protein
MNIAQLRDTVTTLLAASPNLVGSYTLPDNTTIPALYVVGRQGVPTEWKANGLEVAIREFPERLPQSGLGAVKVLQIWEIMLVQYDTNSNSLSTAMDRMIQRFPDATLRYLPGDDIAYERCRVTLPDMTIKQLYPA